MEKNADRLASERGSGKVVTVLKQNPPQGIPG